MDESIWYELESSRVGADDWVRHTAATYDSVDTARKAISGIMMRTYEVRIVRVTQTPKVN